MAQKWKTHHNGKSSAPPNAVDELEVHEDIKSSGISEPANDHDLRYARLLEAITKSALVTREEIATRGDRIEDQVT